MARGPYLCLSKVAYLTSPHLLLTTAPRPPETTFPSAPRDRRGPMCEANLLTPSPVLLRLCHGHLFSRAAPAPGVSPAFNTP